MRFPVSAILGTAIAFSWPTVGSAASARNPRVSGCLGSEVHACVKSIDSWFRASPIPRLDLEKKLAENEQTDVNGKRIPVTRRITIDGWIRSQPREVISNSSVDVFYTDQKIVSRVSVRLPRNPAVAHTTEEYTRTGLFDAVAGIVGSCPDLNPDALFKFFENTVKPRVKSSGKSTTIDETHASSGYYDHAEDISYCGVNLAFANGFGFNTDSISLDNPHGSYSSATITLTTDRPAEVSAEAPIHNAGCLGKEVHECVNALRVGFHERFSPGTLEEQLDRNEQKDINGKPIYLKPDVTLNGTLVGFPKPTVVMLGYTPDRVINDARVTLPRSPTLAQSQDDYDKTGLYQAMSLLIGDGCPDLQPNSVYRFFENVVRPRLVHEGRKVGSGITGGLATTSYEHAEGIPFCGWKFDFSTSFGTDTDSVTLENPHGAFSRPDIRLYGDVAPVRSILPPAVAGNAPSSAVKPLDAPTTGVAAPVQVPPPAEPPRREVTTMLSPTPAQPDATASPASPASIATANALKDRKPARTPIQPTVTEGSTVSATTTRSIAEVLAAARTELTAEGFEISATEDDGGELLTSPKSMRLTTKMADCGRIFGIPFLLDKRAKIDVSIYVQATAGSIKLKSVISGIYKTGMGAPDRPLSCKSYGVFEQELLSRITATP